MRPCKTCTCTGMRFDPRRDIWHDHALWDRLLAFAQGEPEVQGILHYVRCLGGWAAETPLGYRLLQGDMPDGDWADAKARALDGVRRRIEALFPMWKNAGLTDEVLDFAACGNMTVAEAARILRDCPFRERADEQVSFAYPK